MGNLKNWVWIGLSLFYSTTLWADALSVPPTPSPTCWAWNQPLPVNNQQVLHWERTTPNQYRDRAHVLGKIVQTLANRNGHVHFVIQIGHHSTDVIEIIYNEAFGYLPELELGMLVEACGDYITSTARSGPYPPSPVGAIIHWIHLNPPGNKHDPGYLIINNRLYGQDTSHAGQKNEHSPRSYQYP